MRVCDIIPQVVYKLRRREIQTLELIHLRLYKATQIFFFLNSKLFGYYVFLYMLACTWKDRYKMSFRSIYGSVFKNSWLWKKCFIKENQIYGFCMLIFQNLIIILTLCKNTFNNMKSHIFFLQTMYFIENSYFA